MHVVDGEIKDMVEMTETEITEKEVEIYQPTTDGENLALLHKEMIIMTGIKYVVS